MKDQIENLQALDAWVKKLVLSLKKKSMASVITLAGEVGAGKTTLTQSLARALGVTETVTSPTFVIQKEYEIRNHDWIKKMIHIDAYRLEQKEDLEYLGWNEIIKNSDILVIIEWPEMVEGINIPDPINLHLEINNDHTRTITKAIS